MDKLDLSLADISKGGRSGGSWKGRGRGRARANGGAAANAGEREYINPLSRDNDLSLSSAADDDTRGPVRNQRSRQRNNPYARPSFASESSRGTPSRLSNGSSSGAVKSITTGNKVLVTNLDSGVTEEDVEEIFEQAGTIKSVVIKKDAQGRSLGTAEVVFAKRSVAAQTVKDFDSAAVDGRPMYLRLIEGPALSIKRERADQERFVAKRSDDWQDRGRRQSFGGAKESLFGSKLGELDYSTIDDSEYGSFGGRRGRTGGGRGGRGRNFVRSRGRGRGGGGRSNGNSGGRAPTAEQLDQDMDSYFSSTKATAMAE